MITISKKVEYSVVFLSFLAKNSNKTISLNRVSKELNLPYRFLGQLAMKLKDGGIVVGKEGKMGGYRLADSFSKATMYDLITVLGEDKHIVKCLGSEKCKRENGCSLKKVWSKLEEGLLSKLKEIKLNEL